jgi:hypothetical protein
MNTHNVNWNGEQVHVELADDYIFIVHLKDKTVRIQYKPDNEGADHWIDLEHDRETEEAVSLGEQLGPLIEK